MLKAAALRPNGDALSIEHFRDGPQHQHGVGGHRLVVSAVADDLAPIEQHGFTIADFFPDRIELRFFKWDIKSQPPDAIDRLEPFHTARMTRPG